ncbi:hypothetical protein GCM10023188_28050 [Pontibacter saemangeumensis]|uniref:Phage protein n=1 Tax=Pontibacter saemangeumensis TaxID=1084525 RepID=A0ABP8LSL4_9BACT
MKAYKINIVREPGADPFTGELYPLENEEFFVEADSVRKAYIKAMESFEMDVRGQLLRFFIDEEEYFDENY